MLQIKNLSKYSQKKYFFNIITKYKQGKSDFYLFLLYLVLTLINFYIYWGLKKIKNVWKLKKNQSSTKQKKAKINDIELNKNLYLKDKNQILSESKPEGNYSPDKDEKNGISFDISIDKIGRICIHMSSPSQKETW